MAARITPSKGGKPDKLMREAMTAAYAVKLKMLTGIKQKSSTS